MTWNECLSFIKVGCAILGLIVFLIGSVGLTGDLFPEQRTNTLLVVLIGLIIFRGAMPIKTDKPKPE